MRYTAEIKFLRTTEEFGVEESTRTWDNVEADDYGHAEEKALELLNGDEPHWKEVIEIKIEEYKGGKNG